VLDLFSGCGGLTEGFHQFRPAGATAPVFRSIGAVEWEPAAAASYAMNFGAESKRTRHFDPPEIFCGDIVGWKPRWNPGEVDVVVGGPPCQGFSGLNRHKVRADRNQLWQEFVRVVIALQPKLFVIENVDRFLRSAEFMDLQDRIGSGDLTNYRLVEAAGTNAADPQSERTKRYLLNAADYGARQARRRAIVIGIRTDVGLPLDGMRYPEPTHSRAPERRAAGIHGFGGPSGRAYWRTVDDLFNTTARMKLETTELPTGRATSIEGIAAHIAGPFMTTELHFTRRPEPISRARYKAIPPNGNRKNLRGRYLCRFDTGEELIIEKVGNPRDDSGDLDPLGAHREVVDGAVSSRMLFVRSYSLEGRSSSRSNHAVYRVELRDGESSRRGTLEYLSTQAWDEHNSGTGDVMGRARLGLPSVTVRTEFFKPEKGRYLHPTENRPITHFEAAKLQGFPDDFRWCGSKTDIAKQIGNAVPIPLGIKIAESIYGFLRSKSCTKDTMGTDGRPSDGRILETLHIEHPEDKITAYARDLATIASV
jgi:DNA (cytosine-5)-methyltransferase 1